MKFRLELDIKKLPEPIHHQHKILLIGSCFTENIGEKLDAYKFTTLQNPNGILFNPVSVAEAVQDYIANKTFTATDLFEYKEGWHSWKHHSRFSAPSVDEALQLINTATHKAHQFLKEADYIFITFGSAWTYTLTDKAANAVTGSVAANNHKAPANWFNRKLMSIDALQQLWQNIVQQLLAFNPALKIIFTVSPVRHLREGLVENNRSKATLLLAIHRLTEMFSHLYYFPAYELVIDDLRDYRFYAEDLVHPNYFATQYVWEKFTDACMHQTTKNLLEEIHAIRLAYQHKPFNPQSLEYKNFLQSFYVKTKQLMELYPYINFTKEVDYFKVV